MAEDLPKRVFAQLAWLAAGQRRTVWPNQVLVPSEDRVDDPQSIGPA